MPRPAPAGRLAALVLAASLMAGCSTAQTWPAPKATHDLTLRPAHRELLVGMVLGDALHLLLPPPSAPGTQWRVLIVNGRALRQMTEIAPFAGHAGWSEVRFQAIHTVGRTQLKLAAVPPDAQGYSPPDVFTLAVTITRRDE